MGWKSARSEATERRDPMQEFTAKIVEQLELGVKPWVRPWDASKCQGPQSPYNFATGHVYSGVNILCLGMNPIAFQTGDPGFCTYKQAQDHGWQVKSGEHGSTVFLYKPLTIEDEKAVGGEKVIPLLKTFTVFHRSQMTGAPEYKPKTVEECPWQSIDATETIIKNSGVTVRIGGDKAFYSPSTDHIQVPPSVAFKDAASEACVKAHELAHASGAKHRLNRDLTGRFGSKSYSAEELVAEITSSFVGVTLNIPTDIPNHASYIANWLTVLREDKRAIFHASALAQKASDWILNLQPDYADRHGEPIRNDGLAPRPTIELDL